MKDKKWVGLGIILFAFLIVGASILYNGLKDKIEDNSFYLEGDNSEEKLNDKTEDKPIISSGESTIIPKSTINKAKRYECLIVTTYELLKLFEAFLNNQTTSSKIIEVFKTKTGLFSVNDCLIKDEDNSPYMI